MPRFQADVRYESVTPSDDNIAVFPAFEAVNLLAAARIIAYAAALHRYGPEAQVRHCNPTPHVGLFRAFIGLQEKGPRSLVTRGGGITIKLKLEEKKPNARAS